MVTCRTIAGIHVFDGYRRVIRQMCERWCVMSFCVKYRRCVCAQNGPRPTFWFVRILNKIIPLHVAVRVLEIVNVDLEEVIVGQLGEEEMISQRVPELRRVLGPVQLRQVLRKISDALRVDNLKRVARARSAADVEGTLELEHDHLVHGVQQSSGNSVGD